MDQESSVSGRNGVDIFHFALFAYGFFFGVGGVIAGSVLVALSGLFAICWSLLYFLVGAD
jgi:hypothetical protein